MLPIVLASASPRRIGLLRQIGLDPRVIPADIDEHIQWDDPVQAVQGLACRKARDVGERFAKDTPGQDMWILGADTVVVYKGQILGKPVDKKDAVRMLDALQGDTHSVYTGVCMIEKKGKHSREIIFAEETKVSIYEMEMWEIEGYVDTLEPMDKAGAYAIQGIFAKYIRGICGDYNNVVGLPVSRIYQEVLKNAMDRKTVEDG